MMNNCQKCGSSKVFSGNLNCDDLRVESEGASYDPQFVPGKLAWHTFSLRRGVPVQVESACCLDCGLVWSSLDVERLKQLIQEKGSDDLKERLAFILNKEGSLKTESPHEYLKAVNRIVAKLAKYYDAIKDHGAALSRAGCWCARDPGWRRAHARRTLGFHILPRWGRQQCPLHAHCACSTCSNHAAAHSHALLRALRGEKRL